MNSARGFNPGTGVWTFREGKTTREPTTLGRHDAEAMIVGVSPVFCSLLGAHRDAAKPRGEEASTLT
jgi:hypothetical protein